MSNKKTETKTERLPRREFLKGAVISASAAAVAAVSTAPNSSEAAQVKSSSTGGYQETDHVRTYYELARF
ncbi:MAG: twin-arginine translocation signal domain-containing protein [Rhodospirillales bacterium]|nr:twin-arginine translocation signal domain-containing protein [Rhodospirillales bacterium]